MARLKSNLILVGIAVLFSNSAFAHFPWLIRTQDGKAAYFFGESPSDCTYKLPASIAKAVVTLRSNGAEPSQLRLKAAEGERFVGMLSEGDIGIDAVLSSQVTFGIYHGSRLDYYALYQGGKLPSTREAYRNQGPTLKLCAELVDTDTGVEVFVLWNGEPLADAEVQLFCAQGHAEGSAKTDAAGRVFFDDGQVEVGLNGVMVGFSAEDQTGKLDGLEYQSESHYLTVTFQDPQDFDKKPPTNALSKLQLDYSDLPLAITSFGAARIDDAIYVYGGHTGEAHSYSTEAQSNQLLKLDLNAPTKPWEKVAEGERLQGLAMVAHKQRLICIGGFAALNAPGTEHDLHSQASVRVFDTVENAWSDLPSLPQARSSHDAASIGDTIFVVGGWNMSGDDDTQWHSSALSIDLSQAAPQWTEIAKPPFKRRAVAAVAHDGKLYVIGGMNEKGGPTREVAVFDPPTNRWTAGPELAGAQGMEGFGASAWSIEGQLIATTYSGAIQRLAASGDQWTIVGKTKDARFFHRLLPIGRHQLISVGGANMEQDEKFLTPEIVELPINASSSDSGPK
jgi:hypothetical protein